MNLRSALAIICVSGCGIGTRTLVEALGVSVMPAKATEAAEATKASERHSTSGNDDGLAPNR